MSRGASITLAGLALAGVFGCKAVERQGAKQRCDQDRLASLATELDAVAPDARVALVSEGLIAACGDELYPTVRSILGKIAKPDDQRYLLREDEAYRAAIEHICPKHEQIGEIMAGGPTQERGVAVAELCEFSRYELLSEAELRELSGHALFVWATHDFLLESGTAPERARTISRALFRVHEETFAAVQVHALDGQRLLAIPAAAPLRSGATIYISTTELVFNEEQLAQLDAGRLPGAVVRGHVIMPLFEKLEDETEKMLAVRGEQEREHLALLVVDGGVRFATVVDTMYTAGRLGYERFDLVVEPIYPVKRAIYVNPPKFEEAPPPEEFFDEDSVAVPDGPPRFKLFILDDAYRVSWGSGQDQTVTLPKLDAKRRGPDAWDHEGLAKLVRERTAADPQLEQGVIAAENPITMDVVLATLATLLGPDCKQHEQGAGCLLPDLVLEAGAG